jgi:hypothetical protein
MIPKSSKTIPTAPDKADTGNKFHLGKLGVFFHSKNNAHRTGKPADAHGEVSFFQGLPVLFKGPAWPLIAVS